MGKNKNRLKSNEYDETRRKILLEDNENEDKTIKRLEKKLKIPLRTKDGRKKSRHPTWIKQCGLDYILDFEEEVDDNKHDEQFSRSIGVCSKKTKNKTDIYGQLGKAPLEADFRANSTNDKIPVDDLSSHHPFPVQSCSSNDVSSTPDSNDVLQPDVDSLRRSIRSWINKVSEAQMARVVSELTNLFSDHPRASVRLILVDELCTLLESSPVNTRSNTGWLQQELAVCIACVHISLHMKLQHDNVISYVVEKIVDTLFDQSGNFQPKMGSASFCLFLSYLYRFEVLSANLIFDIVQKLLHTGSLHELKVAHFICEAVGVNLRKANLNLCQNITQEATKLLVQCTSIQVEVICELEAIIQRLSEKRSKNEGVLRALHLKKMMRTWVKATSLPDDMCLPVCLSDILNRASAGRWWIVGVAGKSCLSSSMTTANEAVEGVQSHLPTEVEAAAARLGLRTEARKSLFHTLASTPGGPGATATALIKACSDSGGGTHAGVSSKEREMVQIVVHCLMAENPFNRFYPRVLGGLINYHRRFLMMIKCAFWDVMKKTELSMNAKANAGEALGLLARVYELPLTVLKNFNFGDTSEGNVTFLKQLLTELCTGDYQTALKKLMQLSCYTHLSRNCRIFMRKHFSQDPESHVKACILRLITDMRESESF